MSTKFLRRPHRGELLLDSKRPERGYLSVVNEFSRKDNVSIEFIQEKRGPDDYPLWCVRPTIMGEEHKCFEGSGLKVQDAKNACAAMIAKSGYCVRGSTRGSNATLMFVMPTTL